MQRRLGRSFFVLSLFLLPALPITSEPQPVEPEGFFKSPYKRACVNAETLDKARQAPSGLISLEYHHRYGCLSGVGGC